MGEGKRMTNPNLVIGLLGYSGALQDDIFGRRGIAPRNLSRSDQAPSRSCPSHALATAYCTDHVPVMCRSPPASELLILRALGKMNTVDTPPRGRDQSLQEPAGAPALGVVATLAI